MTCRILTPEGGVSRVDERDSEQEFIFRSGLAIGIVRQIAECFEIFEDVGDALFENVTYE